jgi:MFS family permease
MSAHHERRKQDRHEKQQRVDKRNFSLGVWNGILYNLALSFLSKTTVLPGFLSHLTNSSALIGLVTSFDSICWYLPQLPVSALVQHKPRKMPLYKLSAITRTIVFGILAVITLLAPSESILLITAVTMIIIFFMASGPGGLVFTEMYAKAIPANRRGKFLGLRMAIGGILSATVGASLISYFVSGYSFPTNFGLIFTIGALTCGIALSLMASMREPREKIVTEKRTVLEQFRFCWEILKTDKKFRTFVSSRVLFESFSLGMPFLFLFAHKRLGFSTTDIGIFIAVECVGVIISNYIWAQLADKVSNKRVLVGTAYLALLVPIMIILYSYISLPVFLFPVIFAISASVDAGRTIGGMGYLAATNPSHERTTYAALYNSMLALPLFFASLAGLLLDSFGFVLLYGILLILGIVSLIQFRKLDDVNPHLKKH